MSEESNKEVIRRFYEAFDRHDLEALMAITSDNVVLHTARPGMPTGKEGARQVAQTIMTGFTQLRTTVDLVIAEGDVVTAVHTHEAVQGGPYGNVPATGKSVRINGIEVFRLADGKITEIWQRDDELGALMQLGVIPAL